MFRGLLLLVVLGFVAVEISDSFILRKIFTKHRGERFHRRPIHVQKQHGELDPSSNAEVNLLVKKHAMEIKQKANLDARADELEDAEIEALSYITYNEGARTTVYLIKVIIESQYVVHVKIATDPSGFSTLEKVIPNKEEDDRLSEKEFKDWKNL